MTRDDMTRRRMIRTVAVGILGTGVALAAPGCSAGTEDEKSENEEQRAPEDANASDGYDTVWIYSPAGRTDADASVDSKLVATMQREGLLKPLLAGQSDARVEACYLRDLYPEIAELFYQRGWTDGLPIVPPTEQSLLEMSKGTDLARQEVLGTLAPLFGRATVENVAANAVMAGCLPIHLPFLIAAVQAVSHPDFDLVGAITTTSPNATLLLVNGPEASKVGLNSSANALGRGWRANASLGRALHLVEQNVGGSWPAVSDYSSLGMPGDFSLCFAENEKKSPWTSFAEEQGFDVSSNVVTVASVESVMLVVDIGVSPEGFLKRVAHVISSREHVHVCYLLVLTPSTAQQLAEEGWSKDDIRGYLDKNTRVPMSRLREGITSWDQKAGDAFEDETSLEADEDGLVALPFIKELFIVVAGGVGEKNALMPLWSKPASHEVSLPSAWDDLLTIQKDKAANAGVCFNASIEEEGLAF